MENKHYVFSINLVAYLRANGFKPVEIERSQRTGKVCFWFERTEQLLQTIQEYKDNRPLKNFIVSLRQVRKTIRNFNNQSKGE